MAEEVSEDNLHLLRMIERLAGMAAKAEAEAVEAKRQAHSSASSMNYWVTEANKNAARVKELEAKVNELSSPLADLARAASKEQA